MNQTLTTNTVEADLEKIAKVGRAKRDLILIAVLVGVAGLIAAIVVGFRGRDVARSADAMTAPIPQSGSKAAPATTKP